MATLGPNRQYDYTKRYLDEANKDTRLALLAYGKQLLERYRVREETLEKKLSNMFYNKKRELKMTEEEKAKRKVKNAKSSSKDSVSIFILIIARVTILKIYITIYFTTRNLHAALLLLMKTRSGILLYTLTSKS